MSNLLRWSQIQILLNVNWAFQCTVEVAGTCYRILNIYSLMCLSMGDLKYHIAITLCTTAISSSVGVTEGCGALGF